MVYGGSNLFCESKSHEISDSSTKSGSFKVLMLKNPLKKTLLGLVDEFSRVAGYKFSAQKAIMYVYNCNKQKSPKMQLRKQYDS